MNKKMIAPIVISILVTLYAVFYFAGFASLMQGSPAWLLGLIPIGIGIMMVVVCAQRIHEIRSGEEDDLSKY